MACRFESGWGHQIEDDMKRRFELTATLYDKRGRVLSRGVNSYRKSHPLQKQMAMLVGRPDAIFLHAEIDALRKVKDWSKVHRIRIERYDRKGNPIIAKPCEICEQAIHKAGICEIEYTV